MRSEGNYDKRSINTYIGETVKGYTIQENRF